MKILKVFTLIILVAFVQACNPSDQSTQEEELQNINNSFTAIQAIASSVSCDNAADWSFTSYGSKACGGPIGYIAYPTTIDVPAFLQQVQEHHDLQQAYNEKWGIVSDCTVPLQPIAVSCDNGNPVFQY